MPTVAEHMIEQFHTQGVKRIYGVPGDSLNGLTDALRENGEMEWIHHRHEEGAAFAATAEAELTGELAVCVGSCGPGNLHLINGLYDAQRSRVPVLAIAAQIPTDEIGSNYFQETHPVEIFRGCSVYAEQVSDPKQLPRMLRIAMREAIEKRGVAVLVISGDVALSQMERSGTQAIVKTNPRVLPDDAELARAAQLLESSAKVTILAGAGTAGAHSEVMELADRLAAPIVHSMRGKEHIEYENPFDVGMTGLLGFASGYRAIEECEVLLMLGTDFPYQQFYPQHASIIQVDLRGEQLGRRTTVDVPLVGTVKDTAAALSALLPRQGKRKHLNDALEHYAKTRTKLDELATPSRGKAAIHPQYLARLIDLAADQDAIFTADVGSPVIWAARYLSMTEDRRLLGSFNHGSMANALCHALGAQAIDRTRQVIAFAGDGGLTMMLGELLTATQNKLPIKVVVFNNSSLNFVELEMKAAGFVTYATELENPDFGAVANAAGLKGFRVEDSAQLEATVNEFLAHEGPALLDVVTDRQEMSMPPSIKVEQAKGFALYAIRTVLSGRGDELFDLAKTNWRQMF
ncbi:ubiquinone-dependent pyruvate dehydrogenase [Arthrobacter sp. MYb229]|uniref:ubiquinone-dependent pyruvate dehydrogenase n=1 Tax=unclassified Arthrobacter TaxID=235627 RepID=UPI000CFD1DEB|nr:MULTISPECIES: ubiquinone-dependent pyruvate dehydrogenase [unclassified Arthrobacter]PRA06606.1 ubiquinone-dependent pyruvate dehydrogenase [Arthrobacter sp. MYb229]PRB53507.1 ubiquinone-dependent pyruvate dehydrogenase [Arthrobacter sp. MYb216]